jgi:hypothetical protein
MTRRIVLALLMAALLPVSLKADLTTYSQDFQGLGLGDPAALSGDNWFFFVNAFGTFPYGYGGAAPNGPQISALSDDGNGNQYLNVYSDYNNGDMGNGYTLETNVYQQQSIGAADLNQTFSFNFDYRAADSPFAPGGQTSTFAFIKVFDGAFNLLDSQLLNTTAAGTSFTSGSLSQLIDPNWTGAILQFGFLSNVTAFEPSGIYYDNLSFGNAAVPEPASAAIAALGLLGWVGVRRRRR